MARGPPAGPARSTAAHVSWERRLAAAPSGPDAAFAPQGFQERALLGELDAWARPALGAEPGAPRACFRLDLPDSEGAEPPRGGGGGGGLPARGLLPGPGGPRPRP